MRLSLLPGRKDLQGNVHSKSFYLFKTRPTAGFIFEVITRYELSSYF